MSTARPLSIKEIRAKKEIQRKSTKEKFHIKNLTALQTIPLQLLSKNGGINVMGQQTIQLHPGKSVDLPRSRVMKNQLTNLKRRGLISFHEINA